MSKRRHNWKYELDANGHRYPLLWMPPHVVMNAEWLSIREGMAEIPGFYAWDGCSPSGLYWDTWDGPMDEVTGRPQMYYPSLRHDAGYQHIYEIAEATGMSVREVRKHLDNDFRRDGKAAGFEHYRLYYRFVRGLGWIPVARRGIRRRRGARRNG